MYFYRAEEGEKGECLSTAFIKKGKNYFHHSADWSKAQPAEIGKKARGRGGNGGGTFFDARLGKEKVPTPRDSCHN